MNVLTELWVGLPLGSYSATRGWTAEQIAAAAEELRADGFSRATSSQRAAGSGVTVSRQPPTPWSVPSSRHDGTGDGFDAIVAQLDAWSTRCIAAGTFPPDALERAAG